MKLLLKIPFFKSFMDLIILSYLSATHENDVKKEALIFAIKTGKMPPEHTQALKMLAWNMARK